MTSLLDQGVKNSMEETEDLYPGIEMPQVHTDALTGLLARLRAVGPPALSYLTNEVVNRVPAFWFRHGWYRRVVGLRIADGAAIYRGCYIAYYGPGQVR